MTGTNLPKNKQKKIEELIEKGRKQTYLTVSDISDLLPNNQFDQDQICLLYTSPSPRDGLLSRMPSSA